MVKNAVIPNARHNEKSSIKNDRSNNENSSKFIMVLDDDFDISFLIKSSLQRSGYTVFAFTDPHLALDHLKMNSSKYNLVISDLRMPSMDGLEFIKRVREIESSINVFIMTAFDINDLESSLRSLRVSELLAKPISMRKINTIVDKYCRNKKNLELII